MAYHKEKLLDWEVKSLTSKYFDFSFLKKQPLLSIAFILAGLFIFALIFPIIPPRYHNDWSPPTTGEEYKLRVFDFLIAFPIIILVLFAFIYIRNQIDIRLRIKWIANFKVTEIWNLLTIKLLVLNGWRFFFIKERHQFFDTVKEGQIITIKRSGSFRLIDYYIRDENKFNEEQLTKKASH